MKKIFNILLSATVALSALSACMGDYPQGPMANNVAISTTSQDVANEGTTFTTQVTADGFWAAYAPEWITVEPASGNGDQTVTITVAPNTGKERTGKVSFDSAVGAVSSISKDLSATPQVELTVKQAASEGEGGGESEGTVISIADYIALGPNTDTYIITGAITRVANTTYGNFDLSDGTGTIYVYGLLNEKLEDKVCWQEKELAMGDVLTVKASEMKDYYGTLEIVNAVYISHSKSLIELEADHVDVSKEGGDFSINTSVKGADVNATFDADWITFVGAEKDGENVTLNFSVAANPGVPRNAVVTISTTTAKGESSTTEFTVNQDGSIPTKTIAEVLEAADDANSFYRITGYISSVNNLAKGRFDVTDATGTIYAYNTRVDKDASASTDLTTLGIGECAIVTIIGYKTTFGDTKEIVGYIEEFTKVETVTVAEFLAKEVSTDKWYRITGAVTKPNDAETASGNKFDLATYGNFVLADESGRVYVYGVKTTLDGESKKFSTLGVNENDVITIVGNRADFKGNAQVGNAWYVTHKAGTTPDDPEPPVVSGQTVTEMLSLEKGAEITAAECLVGAVTSRGFVATDGTKAVYVYIGSSFDGSVKVGDKVTFKGKKTVYSGMHEIESVSDIVVVSSGNTVTYPAVKDVTSEAETYTADEAEFVSITGTLSKSGNYYNIILAGTEAKQGSIVYPTAALGADALDGKKIKVTGYFNGLTGSGKYINVIATKVEEVQ